MSEEEKEATEWLKRLVKINKRDNLDNTFAEILLNLIKKQSKEIEELEKTKYFLNAKTGEITTINNSEFISKDKIKAKVEKLEQNASYDEIITHIPRID